MVSRLYRWLAAFSLGLLWSPQLSAQVSQRMTRVHYSARVLDAVEIAALEEMYGTRIVVLPFVGQPEGGPRHIPGLVTFPNPQTDRLWLTADRNPSIDNQQIVDFLTDRFNGEAYILREFGGDLFPDTRLGSDFVPEGATAESLPEIQRRIEATLGGRAILKIRGFESYGSDGRLPRTDKDLGKILSGYLNGTKQRIEELTRTLVNLDLVKDASANLPDTEGAIVERLLTRPQDVIVQLMAKVTWELRVHVIEGRVLVGATVNRFDELGKYLPQRIAHEVEQRIQRQLLENPNMPEHLRRMSATMDVVISEATDRLNIKVVDLNPGVEESGMYEIKNDLYVANLFTERFTGEVTPYLRRMRAFEAAPLAKKAALLKEMAAIYGPWVKKYETSGFWDRAVIAYVGEMEKVNQTDGRALSRALTTIMDQLKKAGLRDGWIYHSFLAEVNDRWPQAGFSRSKLKSWLTELRRVGPDLETYVDGRTLRVVPDVEYSDHELVKYLAERVEAEIAPEVIGLAREKSIVRWLNEVAFADCYTTERLRKEAPSIPWATEIANGKGEGKAFYYSGSHTELATKVLRVLGYYNVSSLTAFSRALYERAGPGFKQRASLCARSQGGTVDN